jgi:hypothetical protein
MLSQNPFGTDKGDYKSYIEKFYEEAFKPFQGGKIDLLEIGFRNGASLALWSSYFPMGSIMGVDNYSDQGFIDSAPIPDWINRHNVKAVFADAYDPKFVETIDQNFDIVIDDGPHSLKSQKAALVLYLPKIKQDGLLIIEDIQSWGKQIIFSLAPLVPMHFAIQLLDFRSDGKGYDNKLFVVQRKHRKQFLNRFRVYLFATMGIGYEFLYRLTVAARERTGNRES